jgi:hypothetical protein
MERALKTFPSSRTIPKIVFCGAALILTAPIGLTQSVNSNKKSDFIEAGDLPPHLLAVLEKTGKRMTSPLTAQVSLTGTITDANGTRTGQINVQAPGLLSYREGQSRSVTFNGTAFRTKSGQRNTDDDRVLESLLAHFPDAVCLQVAAGGSYRRVGTHFRTDDGKTKGYRGPYWSVLAFSPATRKGLARGKALQQNLFIAIDETSGLISEVRVVEKSSATQQTVVQTQFTNWTQQGEQWYPGQIVRLEDGKQSLSFRVQQFAVGPAGPLSAFEP